jgi:hypothetical protein
MVPLRTVSCWSKSNMTPDPELDLDLGLSLQPSALKPLSVITQLALQVAELQLAYDPGRPSTIQHITHTTNAIS